MSKKQKTIQKEVSLTGVGLHTGNNVKMTLENYNFNHSHKSLGNKSIIPHSD